MNASGKNCEKSVISGGPEGIRTLGRSIKSRALYLAELQAHVLKLLITFTYIKLSVITASFRSSESIQPVVETFVLVAVVNTV